MEYKPKISNSLFEKPFSSKLSNKYNWFFLYLLIKEFQKTKNSVISLNMYDLISEYDLNNRGWSTTTYDFYRLFHNACEQLGVLGLKEVQTLDKKTFSKGREKIINLFSYYDFDIDNKKAEFKWNQDFIDLYLDKDKFYFTVSEKDIRLLMSGNLSPNTFKFYLFMKSRVYENRKININLDIEELKKIFLCSVNTPYKDIKRRYIIKCIDEINEYTSIFISFKEKKYVRRVVSIDLFVSHKKQQKVNSSLKISKDFEIPSRGTPENSDFKMSVHDILKNTKNQNKT